MKKIFAYIGSAKGTSSNTYRLTKIMLDKALELSENKAEYEIITSKDIYIKRCSECRNCFYNMECSLDKIDNMKILKEKLLEADIIIFGSGVFFHQVKSDMKLFIDRITSWAHVFKLAGKVGIPISTSGSNGNEHADLYLKKVMASLGMQIASSCTCTTEYPNQLEDDCFIKNNVWKCAEIISEYIDEKREVKSSIFHENLFKTFKNIYIEQEKYGSIEAKYWRENGYFECDNYYELIKKCSHSSTL